MAGTENLKNVITKAINFGMALKDSLEDKKITVTEGIGLLSKLVGFGGVLLNWRKVREEYDDLTAIERDEIHQSLVEELDLEDDKIEKIVEDAFEVLLVVDKLTLNFR